MMELDVQAQGALVVGEIDEGGRVFVQGTVDLKALMEAVLEAQPESGLVEIPVLTLDAVAVEGQLRKSLRPERKCRECGCTQFTAIHPTIRNPNVAICPACGHRNQVPLEGLREDWHPLECRCCRRWLEIRAVTTGPEMPENGGYAIECRRRG